MIILQMTKEEFEETLKNSIKKALEHELPSIENDLITRKEAAKLLMVSLPTLDVFYQKGIITKYKINSRVRIKRSEIMQLLTKPK
jgi:excisionase family DNA binding protein